MKKLLTTIAAIAFATTASAEIHFDMESDSRMRCSMDVYESLQDGSLLYWISQITPADYKGYDNWLEKQEPEHVIEWRFKKACVIQMITSESSNTLFVYDPFEPVFEGDAGDIGPAIRDIILDNNPFDYLYDSWEAPDGVIISWRYFPDANRATVNLNQIGGDWSGSVNFGFDTDDGSAPNWKMEVVSLIKTWTSLTGDLKGDYIYDKE